MLARVLALLLVCSIAHARPGEPIVLVSSDAAFAAALDDALVPEGMDAVVLRDVLPPSSAELSAESRRLADDQHATATVWLLSASAGATLVTYDRKVDRLLVREIPYSSPLSATQAAEAARMVRTMLRALRAAPDEPAPAPVVTTAPVAPVPWLAAAVGIGAWFASAADASQVDGYASLAWRPRSLGVALAGNFATAGALETATFMGTVRDLVLAIEARDSFEPWPDVHVSPAVGVAMHALQLSGAFTDGDPMVSRRYDPAVRGGVTGLYALPRGIDVGVAVSADCLLRRQRYEGATEEVLVVPRLQLLTQLVVGIRL